MIGTRPKVHLSRCDYCNKKIAWSRNKRQWLALAPLTDLPGKPIHRRLNCADGPHQLHDPKANIWSSMFGGAR